MTALNRRRFLQLAALGAAGATLPAISCRTRDPRPNVLFIAFDDLRPWLGCMGGHPDTKTPNIDRLAERGVLFTNAHCNVPLCGGSRTAVLTGLLPETNGVFTNHKNFRDDLPDAVTLQQFFMANGYRSILGGKVFHVEDERSAHESFQPGEANVFAHRTPGSGFGFPGKNAFNWGPLDIDGDLLYDAKIAAWAASILEHRHPEPFFLSVGFFRPHLPWFVPKEYFEPFPPDRVALPAVREGDLWDISVFAKWRMFRPLHQQVLNAGQWGHAVSGYLATIHYVDAMLGRVLDALEAGPNAGNTVIVLWADHGLHLGEKENWKKFTLWEESTRVPLIVAAPEGAVVPGGRCQAPVSLVHLYPTLAELCGLPPPAGVEGQSLGELLRDPGAVWSLPAITSRSDLSHAVRTERWRYIRWGDGSEELYDHSEDEHEWFNLARKRRHRKLKKRLAAWMPPPPATAST